MASTVGEGCDGHDGQQLGEALRVDQAVVFNECARSRPAVGYSGPPPLCQLADNGSNQGPHSETNLMTILVLRFLSE